MSEKIDRRGFLKNSLVAGGAALAAMHSFEEKALSAELDGGGMAGVTAPPRRRSRSRRARSRASRSAASSAAGT